MRLEKTLLISLFILFLAVETASAAFNISVTPFEGGFDLRFGKVDPFEQEVNKEIVVNVTSDIGKQYRVIQTLVDPLSNEQGVSVPQNNFYVYAIRGTNRFGTVSVEQQVPVSSLRTVIYTSNSTGSPDSFNLVYSLKGPFDVPAGSYRARIAYLLEPLDSTQSPASVVLNIFAEISVESKITIQSETGSKTIRLKAGTEEESSFDLLVSVRGNMGRQFQIVQAMDEMPLSSEGSSLSEGAIQFSLQEVSKGSGITSPVNLLRGQQVIYTSGLGGDAEDFVINYSLGDILKQKEGRYRASIKYLLQGSGAIREGLIDTFLLEVEIPRIFSLSVKPEMGGALMFRDLKAGQPPKTNEIAFEIKTNIGKPYQVSQNIAYLFTSAAGETIPAKFFTLCTESLDTKGILKFGQKTEVKTGDMALFLSDESGSADTFKAVYELEIPSDLHAGDYSTRITYSLLER